MKVSNLNIWKTKINFQLYFTIKESNGCKILWISCGPQKMTGARIKNSLDGLSDSDQHSAMQVILGSPIREHHLVTKQEYTYQILTRCGSLVIPNNNGAPNNSLFKW